MKQEPSYFDGQEPALVYIGKKLKDALRLEQRLTAAGIDYGVEADHYRGGLIFQTDRVGAFFYVLPTDVERTHKLMLESGYKPYVEPSSG